MARVARRLWGDAPFRTEAAGDGASARTYHRVLGPGGASFVVGLDPSLDEGSAGDLSRLWGALEGSGVRVPRLLDVDAASGGVAQEDLGGRSLLAALEGAGEDAELALHRRALGLLRPLHAIPPGGRPGAPFAGRALDHARLTAEVRLTCEHLVEGLAGAGRAASQELARAFDDLCREVAEQGRVVSHRDFHAGNVMVVGEGPGAELVMVDFQDAMMGAPQYDLVSLLEDCYHGVFPGTREAVRREYWEVLAEPSGARGGYGEFLRTYDLVHVQRAFKAAGTFARVFRERGDAGYLPFVGPALAGARAALARGGRFGPLARALDRLGRGR